MDCRQYNAIQFIPRRVHSLFGHLYITIKIVRYVFILCMYKPLLQVQIPNVDFLLIITVSPQYVHNNIVRFSEGLCPAVLTVLCECYIILWSSLLFCYSVILFFLASVSDGRFQSITYSCTIYICHSPPFNLYTVIIVWWDVLPLYSKFLDFSPLMTLFLLDFCTGSMVHAFYAFFILDQSAVDVYL